MSVWIVLPLLVSAMGDGKQASNDASWEGFVSGFQDPPIEARPMLRWWWFGGAVTEDELAWELEEMKRQGFGGVEIQPVYPLSIDEPEQGIHNLPYLSDEFCGKLRFAVQKAGDLGMGVDLTLGSGWPYGGPHIRPDERAKKLSRHEIAVSGPETFEGPVSDDGGETDRVIAVYGVPAEPASPSAAGLEAASRYVDLGPRLSGERMLRWEIPGGDWTIQVFVESDTGQQVKRPAVGAEGYVLNHYSLPALERHLETVGEKLLEAVSDDSGPLIENFFCDSWEVFGSNWTPDFLEEFETRRGYDLKPLLPLLWEESSPEAGRVRYDYRKTLSELAMERFFRPLAEWCEERGVGARVQAHGTPADTFLAYGTAHFPEGESYGGEGDLWKPDINTRRTASSAAHLFRRQVCSAEAYTWLRRPRYCTTLEQMKAASDVFFLDGINQIVGHGFPYTPRDLGSQGWNFYAATMINHNNPWWPHIRRLTDYVARMSYLLQQGENVADVLVYLPSGDTWSKPFERHMSSSREWAERIDDELLRAILETGFNFDVVSDDYLQRKAKTPMKRGFESGGIRPEWWNKILVPHREHTALILPSVRTIPLMTLGRIVEFADSDLTVVAWATVPREGCEYPSHVEESQGQQFVKHYTELMFDPNGKHPAHHVTDAKGLREILHTLTPRRVSDPEILQSFKPDAVFDPPNPSLGFVHRRIEDIHLYFTANISPEPVQATATFRIEGTPVLWDATTGEELPAGDWRLADSGTRIAMRWEPFESKVVVFRPAEDVPERLRIRTNVTDPRIVESETGFVVEGVAAGPGEYWAEFENRRAEIAVNRSHRQINVSGPWRLAAKPLREPLELAVPASWTDVPEMKYFSGTGKYSAQIMIPEDVDLESNRIELDLGEIREVAEVWVNGKRAGVTWHRPHRVDVTELVKPEENELRVDVTNLLINRVLGLPDTDYSALEGKYGRRFPPSREKEEIKEPFPSGLIGPVRIRVEPRARLQLRDPRGG